MGEWVVIQFLICNVFSIYRLLLKSLPCPVGVQDTFPFWTLSSDIFPRTMTISPLICKTTTLPN